jgi:hypothetical protein
MHTYKVKKGWWFVNYGDDLLVLLVAGAGVAIAGEAK